mgnify:FL=1
MENKTQRIVNTIGIIFICSIALFLILSNAGDNNDRAMTVVNIYRLYPCYKVDGEWKENLSFRVDEEINICGRITSTDPDGKAFIEFRVYKEEARSQREAIFYQSLTINNGNVIIPVNIELPPGTYVAEVSDAISNYEQATFEIIDNR